MRKEHDKGMTLIVKVITRLTVGLIILYGIYIVLQLESYLYHVLYSSSSSTTSSFFFLPMRRTTARTPITAVNKTVVSPKVS